MAAKDHVAVRLDPPTLDRLDILREVLSTEWHEANQSDVLRAAILSGLKVLEKEHASRVSELKKRRQDPSSSADKAGATSAKRAKKSRG
jgi:hypothetical protein